MISSVIWDMKKTDTKKIRPMEYPKLTFLKHETKYEGLIMIRWNFVWKLERIQYSLAYDDVIKTIIDMWRQQSTGSGLDFDSP